MGFVAADLVSPLIGGYFESNESMNDCSFCLYFSRVAGLELSRYLNRGSPPKNNASMSLSLTRGNPIRTRGAGLRKSEVSLSFGNFIYFSPLRFDSLSWLNLVAL